MRNRRYYRSVCEDFLRVDVRKLSFDPNGPEWQHPVMPIAVSVTSDSARFIHDGLDYFVAIVRTCCNYGGTRPWFRCPTCDDRRAVLYTRPHGGHFECRQCLRLLYLSECEDPFGRAVLKLRKIERRICMPANGAVGAAPLADKPRWQHWRTFDHQAIALSHARNTLFRIWRDAQERS